MPDRSKQHTIKLETNIILGPATKEFHIAKRRAAIRAALQAAVAGLAATTSALGTSALAADDGGTPPWGEVIVGPVWEQANPPPDPPGDGGVRFEQEVALFWE